MGKALDLVRGKARGFGFNGSFPDGAIRLSAPLSGWPETMDADGVACLIGSQVTALELKLSRNGKESALPKGNSGTATIDPGDFADAYRIAYGLSPVPASDGEPQPKKPKKPRKGKGDTGANRLQELLSPGSNGNGSH